jgi:acylphosphatase
VTDMASFTATVRGRVQGVFFRGFVQRNARRLGISGYVRNLPDGSVEVQAEGERARLKELEEHLRTGPPASSVREVVTDWSEYTGEHTGFYVTY